VRHPLGGAAAFVRSHALLDSASRPQAVKVDTLICIGKLCNLERMSPLQSTEASLGVDLLGVVAKLNRLATQRTRLPLPWAQARLLSTIDDQGQTRISELAALDHCSQPTMTMQVRRLEDAGLVTRATDPADARAVLIQITPAGVETLRQVRADRAAVIDPHIAGLTEQDRQTLASSVRVLRRLLSDAAAAPRKDPSERKQPHPAAK
jgi:DNA-binding MarR family transcriptional regulator